ncbi:glycoside hydrolase family 99-like domain-containing protein [Phenylobacterium sp.]|uniref:glycoside hydrolase family 99-like domain-containing protein n=1 Tax=Phenylobacterium sp. TaxID=1871053 RepID=UPI002F411681
MARRPVPDATPRTADAEALQAQRRAALRERRALAEDRWRRYREAATRRVALRDRSGLEQRLDRLLARGKWPGRALQLARSGLWRPRLTESLGYGGGRPANLPRYVRAGPDPTVLPKALFDQAWYLRQNPELAGSRWPPLAHYLILGDALGRAPHPLFDLRDYKARHAVKVAASRLSALQHFEAAGALEGFDPHPLFDLRHYVGQCEELAETGENPLVHYLLKGWREGRDPHPLFAGDWYLQKLGPEAPPDTAPLLHYVLIGADEGRDPHPLFDAAWYAARHRDLAGSGQNPLIHFLRSGARERRNPGPHFDTAYYLEQHAELAETGANPLIHYLTEGAFGGAWPAADFDEAGYLAEHPELAGSGWSGIEHWLRTHGARPQPASNPTGRWISAEALFEQLRANGRSRDPAIYNLAAYAALGPELSRIEAERRGAPAPAVPPAAGEPVGAIPLAAGDIAAANAAARAAVQDPLVFAALPVEAPVDWLAPLVERLAQAPGLAALTPRILTPAGRLWAAGAEVAADGTARRNGAGEPAGARDWAQAREVAAAAGVLVVRRAAFLAAGGLDAAFVTPDAALADLAFRLREQGLATLYDPAARTVLAGAPPPDTPAPDDAQRLLERHAEAIESGRAVRTIAFVHPELCGPAAWGEVVRALPNYRGHYQPHLPADLGFYDPAQPATLRRQAELARRYGLGGLCHPFRAARPPAALLAAGAPDLPFCLRVAEPGGDPAALVSALAPYLRHPGQIRVAARPLLLSPAYADPGAAAWTAALRDAARAQGLGELHLVRFQDFALPGGGDPLAQGFDACASLPEAAETPAVPAPGPVVNRRHQGVVRDYRDLARRACAAAGGARLPVVATGFDDTPLGQDAASVFHHATPGAFQAWLEAAMALARRRSPPGARLVFIHAWNAWTHGACLEPDVRFGHGWLEALRNAAEADLLEHP